MTCSKVSLEQERRKGRSREKVEEGLDRGPPRLRPCPSFLIGPRLAWAVPSFDAVETTRLGNGHWEDRPERLAASAPEILGELNRVWLLRQRICHSPKETVNGLGMRQNVPGLSSGGMPVPSRIMHGRCCRLSIQLGDLNLKWRNAGRRSVCRHYLEI